MRIAIIAPPFISVPPARYGGTELFIAQLAEGLKKLGADVVVYACGTSTVDVEIRSIYPAPEWPIHSEIYSSYKDLNHTAWAVRDCWDEADIIHLNNASGIVFSRFPGPKFAVTLHHAHTPGLSEFYSHYPDVYYVAISDAQRRLETVPRIRTIHHGIDPSLYEFRPNKQQYLSFLGRIAPQKGTHIAIEVAKKTGIPLKIAGEIQPLFADYYETMVKPHIDGKFIEYVGEADLLVKNELLGNSLATLFPIQWDEPFGLVMIEAMATGTPVLAFGRGSAPEVISEGISGHVCTTTEKMIECVRNLKIHPAAVRKYVEENFSVARMAADYLTLYTEMLEPQQFNPLEAETGFGGFKGDSTAA